MHKFWLQLGVLAMLAVSSAFAQDVKEISKLLKSGQEVDALPGLASLAKNDPNYAWSILESARSYYKLERWSEFFGIAYFSRKALPLSPQTEKVRLLEILALLRHCQLVQAKDVLTTRPYPSDGLKKHFLVLGELLNVPATVANNPKPTDKTAKPKGVFSNASLWPAADLSLQKLDPHRLRRKVSPQCEKAVAE